MENSIAPISPFLQPGFLLTVVLSLIGFISWLVKLERRNAVLEKEVVRLEKDCEKAAAENEKDLKEIKTELTEHRMNADIHFNQKVSEQVDRRNELRFQQIENHISEMKQMLTEIAKKP